LLAAHLRIHFSQHAGLRPGDTPGAPPADRPAAPSAEAARAAAPKSNKRKRFFMMGVFGLLALAAASYVSYYVVVGRFYVSTDDAYVRANNTMLGARVAGHITAVAPAHQRTVKK